MATTYSLFSQGAVSGGTGSAACVGTEFLAAAPINVDTIWFYSPAGAAALPNKVYVYTFGGATQLLNQTPTWSGTVGSGWVSYTLPTPLQLPAGDYFVTAGFAAVTTVIEFARTNPSSGPISSSTAGYNLTVGASYPDNLLSTYLGPDLGVQYLPLLITTGSLPNATGGKTYSQTLGVSGGSGGYTWSLLSGTLPAGLTLSSAGLISGSPTAGGSTTAHFVVEVTDSSSATATQALTLTTSQVPGVLGWDLYSTLQQQAQYVEFYRGQRPVACPRDGEPLVPGPPGSAAVLFCRFDGWQFPRDYDAETMAGM